MATRIVETSDSAQTEALGAELAAALKPGDTVLVRGELGAGKTTFVRGAAKALGVGDVVTSPTFSIGHRYQGSNATVSHLDLYRLAGLAQEEPELLEDYLAPDTIAFVEWPEEAVAELRDACLLVTLTHAGADRRRIEVCELRERASDVLAGQAGAGPIGRAGGAGPAGRAGGAGPIGQAGGAGPAGRAGGAGPAGRAGGAGPIGQAGGAGPIGRAGGAGPTGRAGDARADEAQPSAMSEVAR